MVKRNLLLCFTLLMTISITYASEVQVKLSANKEKIRVGEVFKITLAISGTEDAVIQDIHSDPLIKLNHGGGGSSIRVDNGAVTKTIAYYFYAVIKQTGQYTFGPVEIEANNQIYQSDILSFDVSAGYSLDYEKKRQEQKKAESYLLKLDISKNEAYVNEYIDLSVRLYKRLQLQSLNYEGLKLPKNSWVESHDSENDYLGKVTINGFVYEEYEIEKKRIFIAKPGEFLVPAVVFNFKGYKQDEFFGHVPETLTLKTEAAAIKVNALPLTGESEEPLPKNVGQFKLYSSLSKSNLTVKDTTTLNVVLEGEGNFHNIDEINIIHNHQIEKFSSKSNLKKTNLKYKVKTWEIILIPNRAGQHHIKVDDFTYFDPAQEKYVTLKGRQYVITAKNFVQPEKDDPVVPEKQSDKPKNIRLDQINDINYITTQLGRRKSFFQYDLWIKIIIINYLILVAFIGLFFALRLISSGLIKNRLIFEHRNAYKVFYKNINNLIQNRTAYENSSIADFVSLKMEQYFSKKFNINAIQFTKSGIKNKLKSVLTPDELKRINETIDHLDRIRFGDMQINHQDMETFLKQLLIIIKKIDAIKR